MARPNKGARLAKNNRGVYEIRWTQSERSKRVSTRTTDLQEAQRFLAGWYVEKEKDDAAKRSLTVSVVLDDYLHEHCQEQVIDIERIKDCISVLKAELGDLEVRDLTADRILLYKKRRKGGLVNKRKVSDSTIRRELNTLIAACNYAIKQTRLDKREVPAISLPPSPPPKDLWLTLEESDQLIAEAAKTSEKLGRLSRIHRFVAIALETASRKTAILELKWSQVDLNLGVINFQANGKRQKNKRRVPVPISDRLMPLLRRAYAERLKKDDKDALVMDTAYSIQHHFDDLIEAVTATTKNDKFLDVTPHTLRHTWATLAAQAGVDMWQIAGVLWDTIGTVTKNYLHHSPEHLRGAVNFRTESTTPKGQNQGKSQEQNTPPAPPEKTGQKWGKNAA